MAHEHVALRRTASPSPGSSTQRNRLSLPAEDSAVPLLSSEEREESTSDLDENPAHGGTWWNMKFFDNLRGWDKTKRYRYGLLLVLSLSGDGW